MTCRLCGQNRKLIKAHAIPEAFFRVLREGGETPLLISNSESNFPKRSPIGVYDRGILCESCESTFGLFDTYGVETLIQSLDKHFKPIVRNGEALAYVSDNIDQQQLKMFVLSVLWRASVSTQDFYWRVDLGPHEARLRQIITNGTSKDMDQFSVTLSKWVVSEKRKPLVTGLMSPFTERWDGVNAVRLYFGWVVAYIKVDRRRFPNTLRQIALGNMNKTVMIAREFDDSKDFGVMRRVARIAAGDA